MSTKYMMVGVAVAMVAGTLLVQQSMAVTPTLTQGTQALNVSGSLNDNGDDMIITLGGSYGHFLMDNIEAGLEVSASFVGSDDKTIGGGVYGEYNVPIAGQLVPYVGAGVGLLWMDSSVGGSDSAVVASGYGGARYFFVDYAAIGAELALNVATEDIYNGGKDAADWELLLNTSWYF